MQKQTVKVRVFGTVQGVAFRYHTLQHARSLGLAGWVRNCSDGSVEAVVSGPRETVRAMLDWLRRGPTTATVTSVDIAETFPLNDTLRPFEIRS